MDTEGAIRALHGWSQKHFEEKFSPSVYSQQQLINQVWTKEE
ncbi:hypothetical protein DBT_2415 [Dissulfuribacter thermophilus]|uniref:Uncharacterized protein n=1 Tax=Dissulfuribacter thermophilus TaxID=1156395 RepID=A0A1B9F2Q9_9BACT|nr:hypothetical protein DBT_2415 [Dissulfuribacter thermophilus]